MDGHEIIAFAESLAAELATHPDSGQVPRVKSLRIDFRSDGSATATVKTEQTIHFESPYSEFAGTNHIVRSKR